MNRLGILAALSSATLALVAAPTLPALAAGTVQVSGVVSVAGAPRPGAVVTLGTTSVTSGPAGDWSVAVPTGQTSLRLKVTTPHGVRPTTTTYGGTLDLTADRTLDLAVPGDRATTMRLTEADGTTPVVQAEYSLAKPTGFKVLPSLGVLEFVAEVQPGADQAVTDGAGEVTFYVPDVVTSDRQTATLTAYDPRYLRPSVSTQLAYPQTPATVSLAFPATSPPSAPRSLAVTGISQTAATFAWAPPASDGGSAVTGYRVAYAPTGGQGTVLTVPATSSTSESVRVTDLKPGQTYSVDVRATNAAGLSSTAATTFTTTKIPVQARVQSVSPAAPVSGQPAVLTIDVSGASSIYAVSGTVTVYDGGVALGTASLSNGRATLARPFLAGSHALTVAYSGDVTHLSTSQGSSSPATSLAVARAGSATTATSVVSGKGQSRDVALTVDVRALSPGGGTPTGTVTVRDSVSGATRTLTLSGGSVSTAYSKIRTKQTVTFTITYTGGPEHNGSSTTYSVAL